MLTLEQYKSCKTITIVSVIEDRDYFLWQQEVQSHYIKENFPYLNLEVIVIYEDSKPSEWAKHLSTIANTSYYKLTESSSKTFKGYKPAYKPYGLYLRTSDTSKPKLENILAIDSDVIFNKDLDYQKLTEDSNWYFSNCESYLGYNYLKKHLTDGQISELANIVGVNVNLIKETVKAGGAQYLYKNAKPEYFKKSAYDSIKVYEKLKEFQSLGSKIQIHCSEMWTQLWNAMINEKIEVTEDMSFTWAPDKLSEANKFYFTHFAGSPGEGSFEKVKHSNPFKTLNLSEIAVTDNCAYKWATLIERYKPVSFTVLNNA
jgi:hypothetical protein